MTHYTKPEFLGTLTEGERPRMSTPTVPTLAAAHLPPPTNTLDDKVAEAIRNTLLQRQGTKVPTAAAVKEAPKLTKKESTLVAGQKMASAVLNLKLKKDEDFPVTVLDKKLLPLQVAALVPSVDPDYRVQKDEAIRILRGWEDGDKTLLYGPTGSGKSSLIRFLSAVTGRPFIRVNMTGDTESSVLFGGLVVRGGATVWEDGPVTEAVRHGAVLLLDEWELMTPEISMGLQWLFEDDGYLYLKEMPGTSTDKLIAPHKDFRIVCGGNTVGQGDDTGSHAGTNVQNTATIDRFNTVVRLGYLDPTHEVGILTKKFPTLHKDFADKMVKVAQLVRQANAQGNIALTMSPRTLINWARKMLVWGDVQIAFTIAFLDKLRDSDRKVVTELYGKVFGR